ncbi:MAG: hypothetical protein A3F68_06340 [Acidobacteria bacterium RIFCSPLOWO2_12_FULL_54_10]|nr:MAG: hypothetical protein A3F68_06340 [Acidobacteria bacterium RIFCSPLOWO2_12_FULL_54_10]
MRNLCPIVICNIFAKIKPSFHRSTILAWILLTLLSRFAVAQQPPAATNGSHGTKTIRALRAETGVTVDGNLNEDAWQTARISLGFRQRDPQEGADSSERTEFRVLYTTTTLYIGIVCYDASPEQIIATERRRDNNLGNDDTITIALDTFHDHRNSFLFRSNPLGTQYDALITDEGRDTNANWDEKWDVASQVTEFGWVAEFAIPFKSLRVKENEGANWGLDIERVIRRKNEQTYWNNYRRGFKLENASQGGHLEGLEGFDTGTRYRAKPFLVGGFNQATLKSESNTENVTEVGMEVFKYRITPGLTADLTWNTDFAQTEIDDQQVNADSRFPLFFPEKREFFLEGAGIYEFASAQREGQRELKLFHSRRIGISPNGNTVPIVGGGRVTGKIGRFSLGMMNIQTDSLDFDPQNDTVKLRNEKVPESNYGVVRIKRDLLQRSSIGAFLVNTERAGSKLSNRVYGVDGNFTFHRYLNINGFFADSRTREGSGKVSDEDWAASGTIKWDSDFWLLAGEFVGIEPNFRDDLGFVGRRNIRRMTPVFGIRPRPAGNLFRQIEFSFRGDYIMDRKWDPVTRINHYDIRIDFESGDNVTIAPHTRKERVDGDFNYRHGVFVPKGEYSWPYLNVFYTSNPARKFTGRIQYRGEYGFFGGDFTRWTFGPIWKISGNLSLDADYQLEQYKFPTSYRATDPKYADREFVDHLVNTKINYAFNNRWLTTTTLQFNTAESVAGVNFRLNYIFRPGDDFFLIYNEGRVIEGPRDGLNDRSLIAKFTYSFDF